MRRARQVILVLAPLVACNAVLGIHDPEIEDVPGRGRDATVDDGRPRVDADTDADGGVVDSGPDVEAGRCPTRGGAMHDFGTFCIDSTEVTNAAYAAFAEAGAPIEGGVACAYKSGSGTTAFDPSKPDHPMVFVDWCDAVAFCRWAGKHLCGRITPVGGSHTIPAAEIGNPVASAWVAACTDRGNRVYQYGNTFDGSACNILDGGSGAAEKVGSRMSCQGPEAGLFDLGGNVWEWIDACDAFDGGSQEGCRFIGGGFRSAGYTCDVASGFARGATANDVGFRCCF
jgi:formylglycine-generating enzyme